MSTTGSWNTRDVRPPYKPQEVTAKSITFGTPFSAPPKLPIGFNLLDLNNSTNIRAIASADDITKEGFTVSLSTWGDGMLHAAGASWFELSRSYYEYQTGEFSTEDDHPWDKPQMKTSRRINFARPFITPPKVIVFLRQLDMDKKKCYRIRTFVSSIEANGFTIHIDTWADSILYRAVAGWIAYPGDRPYIFSCTANTEEFHTWENPQLLHSKSIGFDGVQFWRTPSVFMAINSLDFERLANLRIKVKAKNVTPTGLTWRMDSWGDSIFRSAGASILAVI
ncbi:hypothetical protein B9Z19DRAFT_1077219 [Tuber borchii]|uniref:H-type lectin domain-containing protein n=1 Tax=Tuber borchii TaxID=42251 RepID=A0A2T7A116_TUBBO|nr:hypothetical protein B9Z19DRAFT_1077219 [Tuber borchii]